jgi:saccharopine dehydrogenase-like NADP-dependent oxidoreductase
MDSSLAQGTSKTRRIVVLGGAGDMARVAVDRLVTLVEDGQFVIADLDGDKAQRVARGFASPRVEGVRADIFDSSGLSELIEGSALVINATGPLFRTGAPVLEACIERGVDYIDFGDTLEAADQLLALSERAKAAGITALICAGLTPGLLGLIAAKAARELDRVEDVDIAWVSAPTPPREGVEKGGVALVEHMLHIERTGMRSHPICERSCARR